MTTDLLDIPIRTIKGEETSLKPFLGKVILVVNVASKCGLTKQYEGLERLYEDKRGDGFTIAAFPANDFKQQEPGSDEEILTFCQSTYDVQFPVFSKISVKGDEQHPLYRRLTASGLPTVGDGPMRERLRAHGIETGSGSDILWNFEKFLIGRNGEVVARFAPDVTADDPRLVSEIESQLAA